MGRGFRILGLVSQGLEFRVPSTPKVSKIMAQHLYIAQMQLFYILLVYYGVQVGFRILELGVSGSGM